MQQEQDELNRIQDFDLDAYLDEVEPTHRMQTVNTRGDLLLKYAGLTEERNAAFVKLSRLAESLPEDEKPNQSETLSAASEDRSRDEFESLKAEVARVDAALAELEAEYGRHKARFSMRPPDKSARNRAMSESKLEDHKGASSTGDLAMLKLMLAAVTEIVIVRDGREHKQDLGKWTVARFSKFLDRIGEGQARLLVDAYLGLASGEVAPPFSQES